MQPDKEAIQPDATALTAAQPHPEGGEAAAPIEVTSGNADATGAVTAEIAEPPAPVASIAEPPVPVASLAEPAVPNTPASVLAPQAPEIKADAIDPAPNGRSWRPWAPKPGTVSPSAKAPSSPSPSRVGRFGLLAASVAAAACIGAAAGAAGVAGISNLMAAPPPPAPQQVAVAPAARPDAEIKALRDAVAQVRGQMRSLSEGIAALRSSAEGTGKNAQAQMARLAETVERLEKAQAEPLARLTKLAATVDRLERREAAPPVPAAATPAPEVTGTIRSAAAAPAQTQAQPQPPLQSQRLARPVVEGWRLHEVQHGVALVEGRIGLAEVMVGDTLRGVGRVQDIRREDGRWVVVTSRGVILSAR